jgi:plasmid stabilization system protein ParE
MRYEFHPEALEEFEEAARYYSRRQPGLELRFMASIREVVDRILEEPGRWRAFDEDVRVVSPAFFPSAFSTRSSAITCLSLLSPIAAESRATGSTDVPHKQRCRVGRMRFSDVRERHRLIFPRASPDAAPDAFVSKLIFLC